LRWARKEKLPVQSGLGHRVQLHHTAIISTEPRYMDRIVREETDIELHPNVMNRQDGFCLS
jgi:hypothetical protein